MLVVDDEEALRGLAAKLLETRGYNVLTAASGTETLALLARGVRVDLQPSTLLNFVDYLIGDLPPAERTRLEALL